MTKKGYTIIQKGYINGKYVEASDGKTYEVKNPSTNEVIGVAPDMGEKETKEAIDCSYVAFQSFKDSLAKDRAAMLTKMHNVLLAKADEFAKIITLENGKPFAEAKGEVAFSAAYLDWYAGEARRVYGDVAAAGVPNRRLLFVKQPVGVVGAITPWNFPLAMIARKAGAAMAAGCTVVLKPAEDTPYSALNFAKVCEEASVPAGVINVITCNRENAAIVGRTLCESPRVAKISFTGSCAIGKLLMSQGADTMKKFSAELGGNAPFIIFNSAKMNVAVAGAMASKFRGSGQTCVCANRIFVQEEVYDEFVRLFTEAVEKQLVLGDGFTPGVTQGPLINQRTVEKVKSLVGDAIEQGATCVRGGHVCLKMGGNFFEPTILTNVGPTMQAFKEEIFGPVACVIKFKTEEEVVELANDTRSGLASYFYSQDYSQVWRVAEKLEFGMVGINEALTSSVEIPFGGVKESGVGREGSKYGLDDYVNIKLVCFGNVESQG